MTIPLHFKLFLKTLLLLFTIAFLGKAVFAFYHREAFATLTTSDMAYALIWGFRFDLSLAGILSLLAYLGAYLAHRLFRRPFAISLRHLTFLAAILIVVLHGGDTFYYEEVGRHLGYELKEFYNSLDALGGDAAHSYALPVTLYLCSLLPLYYIIRRWIAHTPVAPGQPDKPRHILPELQLFSVLIISALVIRGGLQQVPIEPLHAQEIGDSQLAALALDGAYNALYSTANPSAAKPVLKQAPTAEQFALVRQLYAGGTPPPATKPATSPNIVLIFLESWSAAYMHPYGYDLVTTPFFDDLRSKSLTSRGMLAGGQRTTEGLFASLCSAQNPFGQSVAQTQLQNNNYYCLPHHLRELGYYNAFFQGTKKNTSGTGAFAQLLGFKVSYGIEDVTNPPRYPPHNWGLHDPDIYNFTLEKLQTAPRPFFIGINTNSTHTTQVPPGAPILVAGESRIDNKINLLHFADAALQEFVSQLYALPDMQNTILVLVADHVGPISDTVLSNVLIPFLIYQPGLQPHEHAAIITQRDIPPTILQMLGQEPPAWFMGQSLLDTPASQYFADFYHQGEIGWIEMDHLVLQGVNGDPPEKCHTLVSVVNALPTACTPRHRAMAKRALAFSGVAQSLLFEGRLQEFPGHTTEHRK